MNRSRLNLTAAIDGTGRQRRGQLPQLSGRLAGQLTAAEISSSCDSCGPRTVVKRCVSGREAAAAAAAADWPTDPGQVSTGRRRPRSPRVGTLPTAPCRTREPPDLVTRGDSIQRGHDLRFISVTFLAVGSVSKQNIVGVGLHNGLDS